MEDRERQLGIEGAQRRRIGLIAIAAGLIYLIGEILLIVLVSSKEPSVGVLQGLTPALHGLKQAQVDPRLVQQRFFDSHAVVDIFSWFLTAVGLILMAWPLRYLRDATVARSGRDSKFSKVLASYASPLLGVALMAIVIVNTINAHTFVHQADHTSAAFRSVTGGAVTDVIILVYSLAYLAIAVAFILISMRAMSVGLLTRVFGILGIFAGVLFVITLVPLPLVQLVWLLGIGFMLLEIAGMRLPPAWAAGEAIPWVSAAAQQRLAQREQRAQRGGRREPQPAGVAPTPPRAPSPASSKKRKRRRS
jgi:hypothetical protein